MQIRRAILCALVLALLGTSGPLFATCEMHCSCSVACNRICFDFGSPSTCGAYGICKDLCQAAPQLGAQSTSAAVELAATRADLPAFLQPVPEGVVGCSSSAAAER